MDYRDVLAPSQEEDEFVDDREEVLEDLLEKACNLLEDAKRLLGFLSNPTVVRPCVIRRKISRPS
jgi:hypothetical protein